MRTRALTLAVALAGCTPPEKAETFPPPPEHTGGLVLLDLSPRNRPELEGTYGFDLLGVVEGESCITRSSDTTYWIGIGDLSRISADSLTRQAIAAAAVAAIGKLDDADSIVLTRVVTEGQGPDKVCATVTGRAVRLTKSGGSGSGTKQARDPDESMHRE